MNRRGPRPRHDTFDAANFRMKRLRSQGHTLDISGTNREVIITIHRKEGVTHSITITEESIPEITRAGLVYQRRAQTVLTTKAIHAICDWSDQRDTDNATHACALCGTGNRVFAVCDVKTMQSTWWCRDCYLPEARS